jgi:AcrR family transcriptional regulator
VTRATQSTRRKEYAQATRQAILDAARKLFAERGYFATKVDDIAAEARVAPATVYAVTGGKQGLLTELVKIWLTYPLGETALNEAGESDDPLDVPASVQDRQWAALSHARDSDDPVEIIRDVAAVSRQFRENFDDVMRVLLATAPHDQTVAAQLRTATAIYRKGWVYVAERLAKLGALREGIDVADAVDVLWFYFGYSSYFTLHDDNGWSYEHAEQWLADQACRALLSQSVVRDE